MAGFFLGKKAVVTALGVVAGSGVAVAVALDREVRAELRMHAPKLAWSHSGPLGSLDHASMRRGYQVYKQVCAACHSMRYIKYMYLVDVIFTEDEAKAEAEEIQVTDGPDEKGNMYQRPGKLTDRFPSPYPNDLAGAAANNGASPPDLTYMALARHGKEDYIYHLLTNYCDAPAGVKLEDGQSFNPYFPGGVLSMPAPLYNEILEYDDGTPATQSQLAKDVCTFLAWTAEIHQDERKKLFVKVMMVAPFLLGAMLYMNRRTWSVIKNRKIIFTPKKYD